MDKLNRLKWIPMLMKAYSDARVQRELELRGQAQRTDGESPTTTSSKHPQVKVTKMTNTQLTRQSRRVTRQAISQTQRKPRQYRAGTRTGTPSFRKSRLTSGKTHNWQRSYSDTYKSVIVELRETKRKLSRLESIHNQLTQKQQQLDEKLVDLVQKIDSQSHPDQSISLNPQTTTVHER